MTALDAEDAYIGTNVAMNQIWSSLNHANFSFHKTKIYSKDGGFSILIKK